MRKLRENQRGFGAVEALLVLVIIGLISFVGWYIWHATNNTEKALSSSNSDTPSFKKKAAPTAQTTEWQQVSSGKGAFSIKVPDGWNLQNWTSRDYLSANSYQDLTYTVGKRASITNGDSNAQDSGPVKHFTVTGNPIAQKGSVGNYFNETPQDFATASGVTGKRYVHTYTEDVDGIHKGDKVYLYRFEGGKTLVTVDYYVLNGENDQSALAEKAIKTLSFE